MKEVRVSAEYRTQTAKVIVSIGLFILTYLIMFAFAIGFAILCGYLGLKIIEVRQSVFFLGLGAGLASLGFFVLFFLLKFMSFAHKVDRSHLVEITAATEPVLFRMIEEIVHDVGTTFPKKVYLSAAINASVFYDSSFWSMFLPIKKNLEIGLGLVNIVSKSELKAILSHEFGHFSQRSMKVGSYVYNMNHVIYNLLFNKDSYEHFVHEFSSVSGVWYVFVQIAIMINDVMKSILQKSYRLVYRSYMGMSREMEYHADEIAASITGYEPLKSSLLRMSLADFSFDTVLSFYDGTKAEKKRSENIYREHLFVTQFLAKHSDIEIDNGLPQVTEHAIRRYNKTKLVVKDQWASHPSIEDRISMLQKTGLVSSTIDNDPANELFANIERTQKEFTKNLFEKVGYSQETGIMTFEEFEKVYRAEFRSDSPADDYNGYYDHKYPVVLNLDSINLTADELCMEELFSDDKVDLVYSALSLVSDIESIKHLMHETHDVSTFDYSGTKYSRKDCADLIQKLEEELEELNKKLSENDTSIYAFFRRCENNACMEPSLYDKYTQYYERCKEIDSKYDVYAQLSTELQFVGTSILCTQIEANFVNLQALEDVFRGEVRNLFKNTDLKSEIRDDARIALQLYISKKREYFANDSYLDENLKVLFAALNHYADVLARGHYMLKLKLLSYQMEILRATQAGAVV